jgi:hypothetical protein
VLTAKFDILEKLNVPILQTGRSNIDSYKIVNIYKWRPALYIWQIGHTCMFSGYAHASRIIWLNFTQETKKCFKWQEYELKVKILSMHDEALVETIIMDTWNTLFGARTRKFWYFEDAPDCGFSWIRLESELRFSPYLVRIFWLLESAMSSRLYIRRSWTIVKRYSTKINQSFLYQFLELGFV